MSLIFSSIFLYQISTSHDELGSITHMWNIPRWNIPWLRFKRICGIFHGGTFHHCVLSATMEYSMVEYSTVAFTVPLWNIPPWNIPQTQNLHNHGIFHFEIFHGCANCVFVEYSIMECSTDALWNQVHHVKHL